MKVQLSNDDRLQGHMKVSFEEKMALIHKLIMHALSLPGRVVSLSSGLLCSRTFSSFIKRVSSHRHPTKRPSQLSGSRVNH